jgi:hypothetical protein
MGSDSTARVFRIEDANELLPLIAELTRSTIRQLEAAKSGIDLRKIEQGELLDEIQQEEIERVLATWSERVAELGVLPKGFFTCDFQSPNPDTYFCWTYGEESITHTHKIYESYKDRQVLEHPELQGFNFSVN